mmetsp:Transcript_24561/g.20219  ORF Transcript_24561/g.20219 Transcript_24561/m.20219 type:complete len:102 (+) Transcript_24561:3-308(+)
MRLAGEFYGSFGKSSIIKYPNGLDGTNAQDLSEETHGLIPRAVEQLNNKDIIILTRGERLFESRMSMLHMNIESLRGAILDNRIATTQKIMATLSINLVAR